jgi:L-aminopeptidase/D-esterase-like protein
MTSHGPRPGPTNSLVDVPGLRVGHHERSGDGWMSGTTVVLVGEDGATAGVDVRGGAPATRETDLLDPLNVVERVHALTLSGGSAFGLAAADGVMARLEARGIGVKVATPPRVGAAAASAPPVATVPIVPTAAIFDLGRGGDLSKRPDPGFGAAAFDAAEDAGPGDVPGMGAVGGGAGAVAGGLKGAVGSASAVLGDGATVAALVVVNSAGSTLDPATGQLYGARFGLGEEFAQLRAPTPQEVAAHRSAVGSELTTLNTSIAVVATDARLSKAQCTKLAGIGHDGFARAIRPVHTMVDGDTVFAVATGGRPEPEPVELHHLLTAAADCVSRAVAHGMLAATSVTTEVGIWDSYRDRFPSALADG